MTDLKQTLREASAPASDWRASLRDFLIALLVFGAIFGAVAVDSGNAFPMPPPPELTAAAPVAATGRFCCRTGLRGRANRDSVDLKRPSTERFDDGAAQV